MPNVTQVAVAELDHLDAAHQPLSIASSRQCSHQVRLAIAIAQKVVLLPADPKASAVPQQRPGGGVPSSVM